MSNGVRALHQITYKEKLEAAPLSLTFDDVLILPAASDIDPRSISIGSAITSSIRLESPFLLAGMHSSFNAVLAIKMAEIGGVAVIPPQLPNAMFATLDSIKSTDVDRQRFPLASVDSTGAPRVGAALSVDTVHQARAMVEHGADFLILESPHAQAEKVLRAVSAMRATTDVELIVGNIATPQAAEELVGLNISAVKVGIGQGSICTTSRVTGVGAPLLSSVALVADALVGTGIRVIADGGIRTSGDIVKALSVGADVVCIGNLFSRATEASGEIVHIDGIPHRKYSGNPYRSLEFTENTGIPAIDTLLAEYPQEDLWIEGASGFVPVIGPLHLIVTMLCRGIQGGFGFVGATNIDELRRQSHFVRITSHGNQLAKAHSLINLRTSSE